MVMITQDEVVDVLKQCYDPEIPVDLWSLGLIYNIAIKTVEDGSANIDIIMTLTTPGCSMGQHMAMDIKTKLELKDSVDSANVEVTFDPPWTPEMMNDEAREKLGFGNVHQPEEPADDNADWE
jgi:metal-sulfur cluster biosynthetic enzyme